MTGSLNRRGFLALAAVAGAACGRQERQSSATAGTTQRIEAAEAARPHSGRTVQARLTAAPAQVDLGGPVAQTLSYNDQVPDPLLRANVGDELAVTLANALDHSSSVHWHGLALRNDMDGAAPATPDVAAGAQFTYRFTSPHPGTYWAHPHTGLDADEGLYLPVIIDDRHLRSRSVVDDAQLNRSTGTPTRNVDKPILNRYRPACGIPRGDADPVESNTIRSPRSTCTATRRHSRTIGDPHSRPGTGMEWKHQHHRCAHRTSPKTLGRQSRPSEVGGERSRPRLSALRGDTGPYDADIAAARIESSSFSDAVVHGNPTCHRANAVSAA